MRRACRKDSNQNEIEDALRKIGCSVKDTSQLGDGFGDMVVGYRGTNFLIEVKDGDKPPSKRKLTPDEERFHNDWRGTIHIVKNIDEAIEVVNSDI